MLCQNDKLQGVNLALISLGNLNLHIFPKGRIYDNLRFICGRTVDIGKRFVQGVGKSI